MTSRKTNQTQKNDILVNNKLIKSGEIHTEICMQVKKQQLEPDMEQQVPNQERSTSRLYIVTLLI